MRVEQAEGVQELGGHSDDGVEEMEDEVAIEVVKEKVEEVVWW